MRNVANADFVTKSFATRCRLRSTLRPSATQRRNAREVAAHEHEVGDAARHLRAAALRDREPRRLERRHVVDAVADHRDVAAAPPSAPRRRASCPPARCGRSPRAPSSRRRSAAVVAGRSRAVERRPVDVDADVGGDGGDGRRAGRRRAPGCGRPAPGGTRPSRARRRAAARARTTRPSGSSSSDGASASSRPRAVPKRDDAASGGVLRRPPSPASSPSGKSSGAPST